MNYGAPSTCLRFGCWAIVTTLMLSATAASAQQEISKSEIVTITDADKEFFNTVDELRAHFEKIAASSPAFREAEDVAKRLASDPLNDQLKKQLIDARSKVLDEKSIGVREAAKNEKRLDSVYDSLKKQMDAQLAESQAAIDREESAENGEADYLSEALTELKQLDQLLPRHDDSTMVSTDINEVIQLTVDQHEAIRKFKQQLNNAELEMKLAQQSVDLHKRQLALMGLARIRATEDYLDLKMAIASAKADQAIFGAIARSDLVALKVISQQERLKSIMSRPPVKYRSPAANSVLGDGFQFGGLPSQGNDFQQDAADNKETIERVQKALDERKNKPKTPEASDSNVVTQTTVEKRK